MAAKVAELHPYLDLANHSARREASYAHEHKGALVLGNGFLEIRIRIGDSDQDAVFLDKFTGEKFNLSFTPFEVWAGGASESEPEISRGRLECRGSPHASAIRWSVSFAWFDVELSYILFRGDHYVRKSMVVHNVQREGHLSRVSLFKHRVAPQYRVLLHDGGMFYPIVFLRGRKSSLFLCGEYAGYFATVDGEGFTFDYFPGAELVPGRSCQILTSHIGISSLTGRTYANPYHEGGAELDMGERQWFREFLVRNGLTREVPYLQMEAPGLGAFGPSDLEVIDQCAELGVRHVMLPRVLESVDSYPGLDVLKARLTEQQVAATFLWSRYNHENLRSLAGPPATVADGPEGDYYFVFDRFRSYLIEHHLTVMERHGFRDCEVTGAPILPYMGLGQSEPHAEIELLHKAFQGLVDVVATLRENFGNIASSGVYSSYGVGLGQLFDATGLLAEDHPLPLPDLHPGRQFGDMTRLYFRRSHDFLMPKTRLTTSVGLAPGACPDAPVPGAERYPWHAYHDSAGWRYALLSAVATGLRHRFHALPAFVPPDDLRFARRWLAWEQERMRDLWEVDEILDEPGLNSVDGYSYTTAHGSVVFLFNTSYDSQDVTLQLRLSHDSDYVVRELYPRELNYLGPKDGLFRRDSTLSVHLSPKEARVIEAVRRSPAAARRKRPELFGAVGHAEGDEVVITGPQGTTAEIGIRAGGRFKRHAITFPGNPAVHHLTGWTYAVATLSEGAKCFVAGIDDGAPCTPDIPVRNNVWLATAFYAPESWNGLIDMSPFQMHRPAWTYPNRVFGVIRIEPEAVFDAIRTTSEQPAIPECYLTHQAMKCGIDLAPLNLGLKVWVNGRSSTVYPALAPRRRLRPNSHPVVAYFFELGSALMLGAANTVVIYARHFDAKAFRGVTVEHAPQLTGETTINV